MRKIINVKVLEDYKLELTFDDNVIKIKDMKPHLNTGLFKTLRKKEIFNSVKLSFGTICWSEDIDMCADYLYETSEGKKRIINILQRNLAEMLDFSLY